MMSYLTAETQRGAAAGYIWDQLSSGKTLARLLLQSVDLKTGAVAILNPIPLDPTQITEFEWGHVPSVKESARRITILGQSFLAYPKANSHEQLAQVMTSLAEPDDLCILENELASAGNSWLKRAKSSVGTHGTEVYHMLGYTDRTKERVRDALREAESLPVFVGAIGRQPPNPMSEDSGHLTVSTEQLEAFAKSAYCVFVGAYDGEGYVLWQAPRAGDASRVAQP
ncbi:MAG: hypothetical protein ABSF92_00030 [Candidatus Acidiferrales bacterium]|jgi:hypothetical protein